MEANADDILKINHLISDGVEDVVLLDSAATISADLTEATHEGQKVNIRYADEDENVDRRGDSRDSSHQRNSWYGDDDAYGKDESQHDRIRKYDVLPVSTDGTKRGLSKLVACIDHSAH